MNQKRLFPQLPVAGEPLQRVQQIQHEQRCRAARECLCSGQHDGAAAGDSGAAGGDAGQTHHHALHVRLFCRSYDILQRAAQQGPIIDDELGAGDHRDALAEARATAAVPSSLHEGGAAPTRAIGSHKLRPWLCFNVHGGVSTGTPSAVTGRQDYVAVR